MLTWVTSKVTVSHSFGSSQAFAPSFRFISSWSANAKARKLSAKKHRASFSQTFGVSDLSSPLKEAQAPQTTFGPVGEEPSRIYTKWTVYKGKGAVTFIPIKPKWRKTGPDGVALDREGALLLEFAKATGPRTYDWKKKKIFALSVEELGSIILGKDMSFFHDPGAQTDKAGAVQKTLNITAAEKSGWYCSLMVIERQNRTSFSVPLTNAEFAVLKRIAEFLIPYLLGMDLVFLGPVDVSVGPTPRTENQ